ncbi:efflux transporter outer membrane subunit [Steroidobacter sp.]|uniref:efflux transporter outer membrane subunit n=1 Tax=Steroidobacter sp. TaxID=1978227 RepID=UPI001A53C1EE|nr:efflux transporter outer membrane subunit [Steroidobacter sp.]MBL8268040.1 efflux transporter outer membrane subunit [Steroidobacter sp.]
MLAFVLSGCMLANRPAPPEASIAPPEQWRVSVGPTVEIERDWWRGYGDPALVDLVDQALARNANVAIAAARVREAQAQERQARSRLFPAVDAVVGGAHARTLNAFGTPSVGQSVEPQLQAAWEVDLFGRVRDLVGATRQQYLASQAAHDAIVLSVASATASAYITLCSLDARLKVARETLVARTDALHIAESRARVGYASRLELAQAQAEYEATAQIIPQVELAIAQQENSLSALVGDTPRAIARSVALGELHIPPIPAGLPADMLRRRPDIAQAEYQLAATDLSLAASRKAFLPNVQLTGSTGMLYASGLRDDPISLFSVGASILAPLFDGGLATAERDEAAAVRDQAAFNYRSVVLAAFSEVDSSLVALQRLAEQAKHLQAQRDALADALRHATNRYRAGYSPYLDQLDAQRGLLAAELSLVQVQADGLAASVNLYKAMGGGWQRTGKN